MPGEGPQGDQRAAAAKGSPRRPASTPVMSTSAGSIPGQIVEAGPSGDHERRRRGTQEDAVGRPEQAADEVTSVISRWAVGIPSLLLRRMSGRIPWRTSAFRMVRCRSGRAEAVGMVVVDLPPTDLDPGAPDAAGREEPSRRVGLARADVELDSDRVPKPAGRHGVEVGPPRLDPVGALSELEQRLVARLDRAFEHRQPAPHAAGAARRDGGEEGVELAGASAPSRSTHAVLDRAEDPTRASIRTLSTGAGPEGATYTPAGEMVPSPLRAPGHAIDRPDHAVTGRESRCREPASGARPEASGGGPDVDRAARAAARSRRNDPAVPGSG